MPGSHIPIVAPDVLSKGKADTVLILPWNICQEIASQLAPLLPPGTEMWVGVPNIMRIA
jgi:hypothetical protein